MFKEEYLDRHISQKLRERDDEASANHVSSGKLSASILGDPLQWQILHRLSIGKRVADEYLLRKFKRGNDVEDWVIKDMPSVVTSQEKLEYRGVVGRVDAIVDSSKGYDHDFGIIPHEVKSVTNRKFAQLKRQGQPDYNHQLQAGLYAKAMGATHFAIDYIASDDYRILSWVYPVTDVSSEIDKIIDDYNLQLTRKSVPQFVAKQTWQSNIKYNKYPDWSLLTEEEANRYLEEYYPESYQQLLNL
jgi:hypothetical protein